mgnify:CR=1 FL=1
MIWSRWHLFQNNLYSPINCFNRGRSSTLYVLTMYCWESFVLDISYSTEGWENNFRSPKIWKKIQIFITLWKLYEGCPQLGTILRFPSNSQTRYHTEPHVLICKLGLLDNFYTQRCSSLSERKPWTPNWKLEPGYVSGLNISRFRRRNKFTPLPPIF